MRRLVGVLGLVALVAAVGCDAMTSPECRRTCENLTACDLRGAALGTAEECALRCTAAESEAVQEFVRCAQAPLVFSPPDAGPRADAGSMDGDAGPRVDPWCDENMCPTVATCLSGFAWARRDVRLSFAQGPPPEADRCEARLRGRCGPTARGEEPTAASLCEALGVVGVEVDVGPASPWASFTCEELVEDPAAFASPVGPGAYDVEVRVLHETSEGETECVRWAASSYVINERCRSLRLPLPTAETWDEWEPCPTGG